MTDITTDQNSLKHPTQPVYEDSQGVYRFKKNAIVDWLLEEGGKHGLDLNRIAREDFTRDDRIQFAQLIGYSVYGWGTLGYVDDATYSVVQTRINEPASEENEEVLQLRARIAYLERKLNVIADGLRVVATDMFSVHADDLQVS